MNLDSLQLPVVEQGGAHLSADMSWVAVHEQYMPFSPPCIFGDGRVFGCAEWSPTCLPPLPQELSAFQAQWERWRLGQVGFDKRTNVLVQVLESDIAFGKLNSFQVTSVF